MARTKPLACGGKGPCCHIGYSHRHCPHCDVVIDTRPANWWYSPYVWPWNTAPGIQPYRPFYNTFGGSQLGNNFGNVGNAVINGNADAVASGTLYMEAFKGAANSSLDVKSLPEPTVAHVCEVK